MSMQTRQVRRAAAAVAAGVALLLTGCSSASSGATAHTSATGSASVPPTGATATPADGRNVVDLTDYSNNDSARSTVVLTGAVGDYGHAVTVHGSGSTDPEHGDQLELRLTHGSFRLRVADLDKKIVDAFTNFPPDTTTCSGRVSATGPAPIVPGSGAGEYRKITGAFDLSITIDEVDQRTNCGPGSKFLSQIIVITGSGAVRL
jgi:hypothetical protein